MKYTIKFTNPDSQPVEIEGDGIQLEAPGVVIIGKNKQMVGLFPIHAVAGVYSTDGPNKVVGVQVAL